MTNTSSKLHTNKHGGKCFKGLKPEGWHTDVYLSTSLQPKVFAMRSKPGYFIVFFADGSANGPKSFTWPMGQLIKAENPPSHLNIIAILPRQSTMERSGTLLIHSKRNKR